MYLRLPGFLGNHTFRLSPPPLWFSCLDHLSAISNDQMVLMFENSCWCVTVCVSHTLHVFTNALSPLSPLRPSRFCTNSPNREINASDDHFPSLIFRP